MYSMYESHKVEKRMGTVRGDENWDNIDSFWMLWKKRRFRYVSSGAMLPLPLLLLCIESNTNNGRKNEEVRAQKRVGWLTGFSIQCNISMNPCAINGTGGIEHACSHTSNVSVSFDFTPLLFTSYVWMCSIFITIDRKKEIHAWGRQPIVSNKTYRI